MSSALPGVSQAAAEPPSETFDVAVIGAGVIGCAVARRLTLAGAKVVVIEKGADILDGASKGNSGILHTGFDAPPGSLEQRCIAAGYREYLEIRERLNLPLLECGALVLAWTEEEEARLPELMEQAKANGVADVAPLSRQAILSREPELSPRLRAGFIVPREFVIDPWSAPTAYLLQALANGAQCRRGTEVHGGHFDGGLWELVTTNGTVASRAAVISGMKSAGGVADGSVPVNVEGATPMTVVGTSLTTIVRPMMPASPPKFERQKRCARIVVGGAPRVSSASPKSRPAAGRMPSTWK